MTSIEDALDALNDKGVSRRASGTRTLSLHGTREHIPRLLEMARDDRSPAVRLVSCTGVADILSRYRIGEEQRKFGMAERLEIVPLLNRIEPGRNPAVFSVMACLDHPDMLGRMLAGLRDPRGNVRLGAAVGLWRHMLSSSQNDNSDLESRIFETIEDPRLPSDSKAELARVCAAAGYSEATSLLRTLHLEGVHAELVDHCIEILEDLSSIELGCWWSDGRDGGEVSAEPVLPMAGILVTSDGALLAESGEWRWVPRRKLRFRRKFFRRVGESDADHILQDERRTWFQTPSAVIDMVDIGLDVPRLEMTAEARVEGSRAQHLLADLQPDSSSGHRALGLLSLTAGDPERAVKEFRAAIEQVKTPPDTWFLLGETLHALGDAGAAEEAWTLAIAKARRKKDWQVLRARARLAASSD